MTDGELLRRYVRDHSDASFEELVKRHIHLVYSAALRQVNGNVHQAEDVTQCVFTGLARKSASLLRHTSLVGWLYTSTRFEAANLRRMEQRRLVREQEAQLMNLISHPTDSEADWSRIRPLLDDAMHTLDAEDRLAVLMRHFENRSYAEIGASCGVSENAARMRVDRALGKLHGALTRQGVTSSALALAGLLAVNTVGAAPAHLTAKVFSAALAGAATAGSLSVLLSHIFTAPKAKLAIGAISAALIATLTILVASRHVNHGSPKNSVAAAAPTNFSGTIFATNLSATTHLITASLATKITNGSVLHLEIVTADTGKPIPLVPIDYRIRAGGNFEQRQLMSDRFGKCDVVYPTNLTELELTTRKDDFADTRLLWRLPNGEIIPTNYVLRIDRPVPIGGTVVDAEGRPVPGAEVGWGHDVDPESLKQPQSHDFDRILTVTDEHGRWQVNRIAEDMIHRLSGGAYHSKYVAAKSVAVGPEKSVEKQLRDATHVFTLGRAVTVKGLVTDEDGAPVVGANIQVGYYSWVNSRQGKSRSDGTFSVAGCPSGKQLVTAEAPGFAATTIQADLADDAEPVHLILKPGKILRLRVVDKNGNPIPKALVSHDNFDGMNDPKHVQVEFNELTDQAGRVALTNAPDSEMKFDVQASGYSRVDRFTLRPDGEEHIITMSPVLVVHGIVWDEATGSRIPKFRVVVGQPRWLTFHDTTNRLMNKRWLTWLDFNGGTYQTTLDNADHILKFIADGHATFTSRIIQADEGDVEMNVTLRRAPTPAVTVLGLNGRPAAYVDVGLATPGVWHTPRLSLNQDGFLRGDSDVAGSILLTDANGRFDLPSDDMITRVIAASPGGYAEATPSELIANPVMQLQPWGRLELTCFSQGQPVVGNTYRLKAGEEPDEKRAYDFRTEPLVTDARGQFTISKIPPGHHNLIRQYPPNPLQSAEGDKTSFEIRPGETTTLYLGTNNYTVTARLQWPPGMIRQPEWQIMASLHTPMPAVPPEIRTNHAALMALWPTDEFKIARQNSHGYPPTINADNTLSVDEVLPGNYQFIVGVYVIADTNAPRSSVTPGTGPRLIAQGKLNVTVPSDPPTGNLDAGQIELQTVADPAP